jgi:HlyD family secretion protein
MRRTLFLLLGLATACAGKQEEQKSTERRAAVPGIETAVAVSEPVRDAVRAFGAVAAEGEPAEVRDARTQLAEAEARQRLAAQQVQRLELLARNAVAPRKELEAARAEEVSAAAAADKTRKVLASFGTDSGRAPLAAEETWVIAQVPQADVARIAARAETRFAADAFPGRIFDGRVDAAPPYVDPSTRMAPVRVRVRDAEHVLRPGMTGAVAVEVGEPHPAVIVPLAAVVYDGAQPVVFVAEGDGHYTPRPVELGVARDARIAIRSGLEAGAQVAVTGAAALLSARRLPAGGAEED